MRDIRPTDIFTSDWHFGHANILNYCPQRREYLGLSEGAGVEEMNEALVGLWNDQIRTSDTVYMLGDACMGKVAETLRYITRLNGHKFLVLGNHDRPHPIATKDESKRATWEGLYFDAGFDVLGTGPWVWSFDGAAAQVCHFPYAGVDHSEDRYNAAQIGTFLPTETDIPLVHGHVHDMFQTRDRMFNVGIDAWAGRVLTGGEISEWIKTA